MIKFLKKIPIQTIKKFFFDVEHRNIEVSDPKLVGKIKRFYSKKARDEKQSLIDRIIYYRGLKHAARGPHAARERLQCGPRTSEKMKIFKET